MKTLLERTPLSIDTAILLIRVVLAGLLGYHGYDKLMAYERMVEIFPDTIGVGGPLTAHLAIFAEFFCSIFIAVGFLTVLLYCRLWPRWPPQHLLLMPVILLKIANWRWLSWACLWSFSVLEAASGRLTGWFSNTNCQRFWLLRLRPQTEFLSFLKYLADHQRQAE